jgi:hypothetical protein
MGGKASRLQTEDVGSACGFDATARSGKRALTDHLSHLDQLVSHEVGPVLSVGKAHCWAEGLGPEEDARLIESVQHARIVRVVRPTNELRRGDSAPPLGI